MIEFWKYEGLGNDFVVLEGQASGDGSLELNSERAARICDRHLGVGADGVLWVTEQAIEPGATAQVDTEGSALPLLARMQVFNADGSRPEMCGNGLRCVALHLAQRALARGSSLTGPFYVNTDAGLRRCSVMMDANGEAAQVTVEMGLAEPQGTIEYTAEGELLRFDRVSMGNPHAILFDERFDLAAIDRIGAGLSAEIKGGTNVEFVSVLGPRELGVVVWERGVGRTEACGTGACATAVAAIRAGKSPFDEPIRVRLPGGALTIQVASGSLAVTMTGAARRVFQGRLSGASWGA